MDSPELTARQVGNGTALSLTGALVMVNLETIAPRFRDIKPTGESASLDLSGMTSLDTGGAWVIADLVLRWQKAQVPLDLVNTRPEHLALIQTVQKNLPDEHGVEHPPRGFVPWLARLGQGVVRAGHDTLSMFSFLGLTLHRLFRTLLQPWRLRGAALTSQMQDAGLNAVPIVALMGFLIGVVLAFQGAAQLQQFGAEVFVVELISISILRELGILLTAIIVAGRSGSAFTASVGSMKVQEEIDAMQTLGLDPIEVLVLPRVMALLIVLPILGFIANMAGLFGGALMSWIDLGVSPGMFVTRLKENTDIWHLLVGMIKAPFFAVAIGVIACWQALQVQGSAASVGRRTTSSVVQAIFVVIALDALFSIFFSEMGL